MFRCPPCRRQLQANIPQVQLVLGAMSSAIFFVQRDEETCRKRCSEIQEVLAEAMPATKKFGIIFQLVDQYTDEDSDVNLLRGIQMPTHGPVCIPAKTAEAQEPAAGLASVVPEPPSFSMEPKPPEQPASSSTAANANPLRTGSRGASALTADKMALIEKNKKPALERRSQLQAETRAGVEQHIFESMQWLPN